MPIALKRKLRRRQGSYVDVFEQLQRYRTGQQHRVVKLAYIVLRAEHLLCAGALRQKGQLSQHVGAGLPRPHAIAFDFSGGGRFGIAERVYEVANRLFPRPSLAVQPRVDHQTHCAQHRIVQLSDVPE